MENPNQNLAPSPKQQIVERIKQSTTILVTVSSNPSVDALSSLLAFALILNKLDKHATAVFSGAVPPAIKFLQPDKTFQQSVDGLRDFIIALDKEKADRLRYKVENDVVKIYITPYHSVITERDLRFSQGELNVDLIIGLGVEKREDLDRSVTAHGRILHDATIMTINAVNQKSSLGVVDWQDANASSLSEMLVSMTDSLQSGLLDPQIATALLTGIVAATDRFSNQRTTPRVMTMAAQLMAAGANQQLVASNLRAVSQQPVANRPGIPPQSSPQGQNPTQTQSTERIQHKGNPSQNQNQNQNRNDAKGEMTIRHEYPKQKNQQNRPNQPNQQRQQQANQPPRPAAPPVAFAPLASEPSAMAALPPMPEPTLQKPVVEESNIQPIAEQPPVPQSIETPVAPQPQEQPVQEEYIDNKPSWMQGAVEAPTFGGSLSATAEEALDDKMRQEEDDRNHTLLSHDSPQAPANEPASQAAPATVLPVIPSAAPEPEPVATPTEDIPLPKPLVETQPPKPNGGVMDAIALDTEPTINDLQQAANTGFDQKNQDVEAARRAVNEAFAQVVPDIPMQPQDTVAPQLTIPAPDNQPLPPPLPPTPPPQQAADESVDFPPLPPLPNFNTLPPAPAPTETPTLPPLPETPLQVPPQQPPQNQPTPQAPVTNDPGQFRIPGT